MHHCVLPVCASNVGREGGLDVATQRMIEVIGLSTVQIISQHIRSLLLRSRALHQSGHFADSKLVLLIQLK